MGPTKGLCGVNVRSVGVDVLMMYPLFTTAFY